MMAERIKPRALRQGSRLGIVSMAGAPKPDLVGLGLERLRSLGYETVMMPNAMKRGPFTFAGTEGERIEDLHAAFEDKSIDGIISTRGGWGSVLMLPHLDKELVRANPKVVIGYSDITSVHAWLQREAGLVSFYAPMVAADFARGEKASDGADLASWNSSLTQTSPWSVGVEDGMRVLQSGDARGEIFGGCISIVAQSLGTPYAMQAPQGDAILFVEDVGAKPYQWDRYLVHLRFGGLMERVRGIVFGDMKQCVGEGEEYSQLLEAIRYNLRDFRGPVVIGLRCGHVSEPNITLPLGVQASLHADGETCELRIEEAAVTL